MLEKVSRASGPEPYAQKAQKRQKSNSRKSVRWSAVPVPLKLAVVEVEGGAGHLETWQLCVRLFTH